MCTVLTTLFLLLCMCFILFHFFCCLCVNVYCTVLLYFYILHVLYSVSLCCFVCCLCVNVYSTVLLPPGLNPIAVDRIYQIFYITVTVGPNLRIAFICDLKTPI